MGGGDDRLLVELSKANLMRMMMTLFGGFSLGCGFTRLGYQVQGFMYVCQANALPLNYIPSPTLSHSDLCLNYCLENCIF